LTTRKHSDLTEDPIHEQLEFALAWAMKNRNLIVAAVAVLIALAAGAGLYTKWHQAREDSATTLFMQGLDAYRGGDLDQAHALLTELTGESGGTAAGGDAEFYLANVLYDQGEFAAARAAYERSLKVSRTSLLHLAAREGIAACMEEAGQWAEAAAAYREIAAEYSDENAAARNLLAAARCLTAANEIAEADQLYQEIEESYPGAAIDARVARALLGADVAPVATSE
jgi:TolA-binding protein